MILPRPQRLALVDEMQALLDRMQQLLAQLQELQQAGSMDASLNISVMDEIVALTPRLAASMRAVLASQQGRPGPEVAEFRQVVSVMLEELEPA